ncbi:DUF3043 domain-containing protein [Actinomadura parmotrematis]|uniref:DUF3043 domain-containing protein n=1 Tax=Actinomadura parmotrematis TaxID=2864039 RepID=A0ABS7FKE1_9ACTN|nr:DUF3043 domain-containing protein [Actinomadura parmotrematis]MBW8480823.1 DUF3043 domain-containing protein [Actinomadura parmotrematis]
MFRRNAEDAPAAPEPVAKPGGKGRPTPKRSEAEKRRRKPITAPASRKEAYARMRERQASDRVKVREGMARGDDKYLLKRDKGPVKRLARDFVDSRRTLSSYLMIVLFVVIVLSVTPLPPAVQFLFTLLPMIMLVVVVVEGFWISRRVGRLAAERYPDEDRKGAGFYAAMRAAQIRRLRQPAPQVKVGDKVGGAAA